MHFTYTKYTAFLSNTIVVDKETTFQEIHTYKILYKGIKNSIIPIKVNNENYATIEMTDRHMSFQENIQIYEIFVKYLLRKTSFWKRSKVKVYLLPVNSRC